MTKSLKRLSLALMVLSGVTASGCLAAPAHAAPPTVQYSPGYDARLAEAGKAAKISAQRRLVAVPHLKKRNR